MKKIIGFLIIFLSIFTTKAFAVNDASVNFEIEGQAKEGKEITININVDNVTRLYAMSVNYTYNPEEIKVKSIEGAGLIKESKDNCVELGGDTAKDGNRAVYQMTFTGKVDGITGSGNVVKIKAEVLKDTDIKVTKENMDVKLIGVNESYEVSKMPFNFNVELNPKEEKKGEEATAKKEEETKKDNSTNEGSKEIEGVSSASNKETTKKPSIYKKILSFLGLNKEEEKTQAENTNTENTNTEKIAEENKKEESKKEEKKPEEKKAEEKNSEEKKPEEKALAENKEENRIGIWAELAILVGVVVVITTAVIVKKRKNK